MTFKKWVQQENLEVLKSQYKLMKFFLFTANTVPIINHNEENWMKKVCVLKWGEFSGLVGQYCRQAEFDFKQKVGFACPVVHKWHFIYCK